MTRVAILTDSSAYMPGDIARRYNIRVIPLKVHWDEEHFVDGVDITPVEFYSRLPTCSVLPTTSQPNTHEFVQVFDELASHAESIVALLISSGISGTVASAKAAMAEFTKVPVEIVDSRSTSGGLGLIVLAVARAVEQGCSLAEATQIAQDVAQKLHVYFVVGTLDYLYKGGRIGGASRYLGTMLDIKPILYLTAEGKIDALERVRTKQKALKRMVELAKGEVGDKPAHVALLHANAPEEVAEFQAYLAKHIHCQDVHIFNLSPVIATHVGPGTIGLALYVD